MIISNIIGPSFCHDKIKNLAVQEDLTATIGTQEWKGKNPSFSNRPKTIKREKLEIK